jgi:hypothetical protein
MSNTPTAHTPAWLADELKAAETRSGSPLFAAAYRWARRVIETQPPAIAAQWIENARDSGNPHRMTVTAVFDAVTDALRGNRTAGMGWL